MDKREETDYRKYGSSNKQSHSHSEDTRDKITPYFYGEKLKIDQEVITKGFPAIAIKAVASVSPQGIIDIQSNIALCEENNMLHPRNSFFDLHNPDLSRLDCRPKPTFEESKDFFTNYIIAYGLLHTGSFQFPPENSSNEIKVITPARDEVYKDEDIPQLVLSGRTRQLSDSDLDSSYLAHRSPAEFCVTVGSLSRKPLRSQSRNLVRWAEDTHIKEKEENIINTDEYQTENQASMLKTVAVRSIHSIGSYSNANAKDNLFENAEIKQVGSLKDVRKYESFKTLSFASIGTKSNETTTIYPED